MQIAAAILVLLIFLVFAQFDEELTPEAQEWLQYASELDDTPNEGFYYLLGSMERNPDLVMSQGVEKYEAYLEALEASASDSSFQYTFEDTSDKPSLDGFCKLDEFGCLERLSKSPEFNELIANNYWLIERFIGFIEFDQFRTGIRKTVLGLPRYGHLVIGSRLYAVSEYKKYLENSGEPEQLHEVIEKVRHQLIIADTLLHKLIMASILDILVEMYASTSGPQLRPLEAAEKSMRLILERDLAYFYNLLKAVNDECRECNESFISRVLRILSYKERETINMYVREMAGYVDAELGRNQLFAFGMQASKK